MKLRSRNVLGLCLVTAMALGVLAGCNQKEAQTTKGQSGEVTKLVWYMSLNPVAPDTDKVIAKLNEYTREKIGVEIDYKIMANPDYKEKMPNLINAGEYFDICFTSNWTTDYLAQISSFR